MLDALPGDVRLRVVDRTTVTIEHDAGNRMACLANGPVQKTLKETVA
jgi:hypothetical protein